MSFVTRRGDSYSRSASGWLGSGKKRRRSKDIRDYGELTTQSSKQKGAQLQSRQSNCEAWHENSDFIQPSLKEFLQSKSRKRSGSLPSKASPSSEGTIPASVFSTGVRRKVSPNNNGNDRGSSSEIPGIRKKGSLSKISSVNFKENLRTFEEENQPPAKKRRSEKNGVVRSHRHLQTYPPASRASVREVEVSVKNRLQPVATGEDHRGGETVGSNHKGRILGEGDHEQDTLTKSNEQDKENRDPKLNGESTGKAKCGLVMRRGEGGKRRPLSEITAGKYRSACRSLINLMNADMIKPGSSSNPCNSRIGTESVKQRKTDLIRTMADKKKDVLTDSEGDGSQELNEVNGGTQLEELFMDTNELLAELSYCEKMSV